MQYIDAAKNAIQNGEPERAISLLREYLEKVQNEQVKRFTEDLILLGGRFNLLKNDKIRETITYELANQELNKINHSLIEVISELESLKDDTSPFKNPLLMNMPRNAVSDLVYYGFLLFGLVAGSAFLYGFLATFYTCLVEKAASIERLLFIGGLGFLSTAFLFGAYEGINRREGMLVNWKITGPQVGIAILMFVASAVLMLYKNWF